MNEAPWMAEHRRPSPEEMQTIIRRAHAERAKALRDALAALFAWRNQHIPQAAVPASLNAAPCG